MEKRSFTEKALAGETPSLEIETPGMNSPVMPVQFNPAKLEAAMANTKAMAL